MQTEKVTESVQDFVQRLSHEASVFYGRHVVIDCPEVRYYKLDGIEGPGIRIGDKHVLLVNGTPVFIEKDEIKRYATLLSALYHAREVNNG